MFRSRQKLFREATNQGLVEAQYSLDDWNPRGRCRGKQFMT